MITETEQNEKGQYYRIKRKFLWFPKSIDGKCKWLTTATWEEELEELTPITNESAQSWEWVAKEWK